MCSNGPEEGRVMIQPFEELPSHPWICIIISNQEMISPQEKSSRCKFWREKRCLPLSCPECASFISRHDLGCHPGRVLDAEGTETTELSELPNPSTKIPYCFWSPIVSRIQCSPTFVHTQERSCPTDSHEGNSKTSPLTPPIATITREQTPLHTSL